MELRGCSFLEFNFACSSYLSPNRMLVSSTAGKKIECQKVIIVAGGTYPAYGSDGSMYG
jgi:predicted flavoprotein YhiN